MLPLDEEDCERGMSLDAKFVAEDGCGIFEFLGDKGGRPKTQEDFDYIKIVNKQAKVKKRVPRKWVIARARYHQV